MIKISLKKSFVFSLVGILLAISFSVNPIDLTFAYVEFDVSENGDTSPAPATYGGQDRYMTSSQSSSQGSYCYAPPNATIINSCNSGDLSSSYNSGYNIFGQ